jgi:hypothetical protein
MPLLDNLLDRFGRWLAHHLRREAPGEEPFVPSDADALRRTLRPGDVLLIAGSSKLSTAIKYLTQSTWSHATLFVGDAVPAKDGGEPHSLIEVTPVDGCVAVPLGKYERFHTRICRPVGLTNSTARRRQVHGLWIGLHYDMRTSSIWRVTCCRPCPADQVAQAHDRASAPGYRHARSPDAYCGKPSAEWGIPSAAAEAINDRRQASALSTPGILHIRTIALYAGRFRPLTILETVKPTPSRLHHKGLTWARESSARKREEEQPIVLVEA